MSIVLITNAPEAYDYRTTIPVLPFGLIRYRERPVRMVRIVPAGRADYQRDRYMSGLYVAVATHEVEEGDIGTDPDFSEAAFEQWLAERRTARGLAEDYQG